MPPKQEWREPAHSRVQIQAVYFPASPKTLIRTASSRGGFGTTMPFTIHPSAGSRYHIEKKGHFWLAAEMNG
jgi:hypothetical protein